MRFGARRTARTPSRVNSAEKPSASRRTRLGRKRMLRDDMAARMSAASRKAPPSLSAAARAAA